MICPVDAALEKFLKTHGKERRRLLLALSGGPDSQALFEALLAYTKKHPDALSFAVAHINHNWRTESVAEATALAAQVSAHGIPYHEKILDPKKLTGNLEKACREERYKFFNELCNRHGYAAVLTAHHRDDVAETVLKRVFEGSSLPFLSALKEVATVHGALVWRPLLTVSKRDILEYLRSKNITYFDDSTNSDPQFLRARMRTVMLPWLTESFGKEIAPGLCHIGGEAAELYEFLDQSLHGVFDAGVRGPFGIYWDLTDVPLHLIQVKFLVRKICDNYGLPISRDAVDSAVEMILEGKANKCLEFATHTLQIDRSRVFLVDKVPAAPRDALGIAPGQTVVWGRWSIQAVPYEGSEEPACSWKDLWRGHGAIVVPGGEYMLREAMPSEVYPGGSPVSKWWTDHKVPAFLRDMAPLVYFGGAVARELLTGRSPFVSGRTGNIGMMRLLFLCG